MKRMIFRTFIFILFISGCNSSQELPEIDTKPLEGELSFKIRTINSLPAEVVEELDSLEKVGTLDPFQKKALSFQRTIEKYNLIEMPSFYVKIDSSSVFKAYTTAENFEKIKEYQLKDLIKETKKVNIKFNGTVLDDLIICNEITEVTVLDGKTLWQR